MVGLLAPGLKPSNTSGDHLNSIPGGWFWPIFILGTAIFIFDASVNFMRTGPYEQIFGMLYLVLSLIVFLALHMHTSGAQAFRFVAVRYVFAYVLPVLITGVFHGAIAGFLTSNLPTGLGVFSAATIIKYVPLWLIYLCGYGHWLLRQASLRGGKRGGFASFVDVAIIFTLAFLLIAPIVHTVFEATGDQVQDYEVPGFIDMFKDGFKLMKQTGEDTYEGLKMRWNGTYNRIAAPYYSGTVERQQGKPLGVFINEQHAFLPLYRFTLDADGSVAPVHAAVNWDGVVAARTFADDFPLKLDCVYEHPDRNISFDARPSTFVVHYTGEFQDEYPYLCSLPTDRLDVSEREDLTGRFYTRAEFPFNTWGYTTLTFMERDFLTALRRENIDPARFLRIHPRPTAKYTPGPISLGMETVPQPIGVSLDPALASTNFLPSFGVTIDNQWVARGEVKDVYALILQVPTQFSLDTDDCLGVDDSARLEVLRPGTPYTAPAFDTYGLPVGQNEPQVVDEGYQWYVFTGLNFSGERYKTVRCPLEANDWSELIGPDGTPQQFTFVSRVSYLYEMRSPVATRLVAEAIA